MGNHRIRLLLSHPKCSNRASIEQPPPSISIMRMSMYIRLKKQASTICVFGRRTVLSARWECSVPGRIVDYTYKGSNVRTEHYSAIRAEVSDAADAGSRTNFALIERIKSADNILIAGEALSHCVANTVRDLLTCIPTEKLIVLTDVSSNVPGFEKLGTDFTAEVEMIGVRLMTSDEFLS